MGRSIRLRRIVLDFPETPDGTSRRTVLADPAEVVVAERVEEVIPALERVERAFADGMIAAGWIAYEAAPALDPALVVHVSGPLPLVLFGIFPDPTTGGTPAPAPGAPTSRDLRTGDPTGGEPASDPHGDEVPWSDGWTGDLEGEAYREAVTAIRETIAAGGVYQVNLTARLGTRAPALARRSDPAEDGGSGRTEALERLYERLRRAQGRGWHALVETDDVAVLSVSPELFFHVEGRTIVTRPMKGTRPRGRWLEEDEALARELRTSEKELAENRMIVDLLRNDLGRVCDFGSVHAPRLMDVERYRTVHQMTSTVAGRLREEVGTVEVLRALFPCGSVTGAPKVAATEVIAELEASPRGVYCGAVGVLDGRHDRVTFNVAIRTLVVDREEGRVSYGAGGGITWDSDPDEEHAELLAKTRVLARRWPDFDLLETMWAEGGRVPRLERHLDRMRASADYFGRPFPEEAVRAKVAAASTTEGGPLRLRLLLREEGSVRVERTPLARLRPVADPLPVAVDDVPVDPYDPFLHHKTTHRAAYRRAVERHPDAGDVILVAPGGIVTELTRGNLVAEIDGRRLTPPREAGLLAGCLRAELLEAGAIEEGPIAVEDLRRADRLWMVNSLRGWVELELER